MGGGMFEFAEVIRCAHCTLCFLPAVQNVISQMLFQMSAIYSLSFSVMGSNPLEP